MKKICPICPKACAIAPGDKGFCGARANINGEIIDENYGRLTAIALDPIEKKPLRRFFPGSKIFSVGSYGCNFRCPFCQNSDISVDWQGRKTEYFSPQLLVEQAVAAKAQGNIGIAYTYNEPLVGYEYILDCAKLAHRQGLKNVVVTNGYICKEPLAELLPYIDAMNIDLKGFSRNFYDMLDGKLEPVLRSIEMAAAACHVEITTLIIPGLNSSQNEMEKEAAWIAKLGKDIPLHITRFFPQHHMRDIEPASPEMIFGLRDVAKEHLAYVYTGNI